MFFAYRPGGRRRFRSISAPLAALLFLGLAACFPTSEHPVAANEGDVLPDTFGGIWEGAMGDGPATVIFMERDDSALSPHRIKGLLIRHHEDRPALNEGWLAFDVDVAQLRGEMILSVLLTQMDGKPTSDDEKGYYLFRVKRNGDTYRVVGLDDLVTAELVDRGALDGTVTQSFGLPSVKITSSGRDLRAFLMNADLDELFSEPFASFTRR